MDERDFHKSNSSGPIQWIVQVYKTYGCNTIEEANEMGFSYQVKPVYKDK